MWTWIVLGVGSALFGAAKLAQRAGAAATPSAATLALNVPPHVAPWLGLFQQHADAKDVPVVVALAFALRESGFSPTAYNPEAGAMFAWASKIVGDPQRWGANPEYAKAKEVLRLLQTGAKTAQEIAAADKDRVFTAKLWTFGSIGLMQAARLSAASVGYPAALPNAGLFALEANIAAGIGEIAAWRGIMFRGTAKATGPLSDEEWATVRAAYVMGGGNVAKFPEKAAAKRALFRAALAELRKPKAIG